MPIPTTIADLSTTAALNSPAGSDNLSTADDYLRAIQGIVKTVYTDASARSETLTNKTVNLTSNTLSGTTAQFNTALSDGDFATLAGSETLTNKALNGTLGATTPSTVVATTIEATSTIKGATTISVGGATPSASGAGITFPATQSASTDANTLDDYEEGTWTPNQGAGLTVVGAFSSTGTYTKTGRVVTIQVVLSGATSIACAGNSGTMCSNLPFAVSGQAIGGLTSNNNVATNTTYLFASTMYCNGGNVLATSSIIITATYFTS